MNSAMNSATEAESHVRHFLVLAGADAVTEENLVAILKKLPDALEAPSVSTLVTSLREEFSLASDETRDPFEDVDDPVSCQARAKRRTAVKKLLAAVGAAIGRAPRTKGPRLHLEALERMEETARDERDAGAFDTLEEARGAVARRFGSGGNGKAFYEALKTARRDRKKSEA
jgi:hypothetical protein